MRRLTDVTITSDDRPAPPRARSARTPRVAPAARTQPARAAKPVTPEKVRVRRATPFWWRRLRAALLAAGALALFVGGPAWMWRSGAWSSLQGSMSSHIVGVSAEAGLRVGQVVIDGNKRVATDALQAALAVEPGAPILGLDLAGAQARIAALDGIKSVSIERRLPGLLHVQVVERDPIAIWQCDGRYELVDAEGADAGSKIDVFPGLPLVVGAGAPAHAAALIDMLAGEKELAARVKASQWVSGQRWNLVMTGPAGDIEVRLPEDDPATAWHDLAKIEADHKLLERKVEMIDLRLPDRLVLRVAGGTEQIDKPARAGKTDKSTPAARRKTAGGRDA